MIFTEVSSKASNHFTKGYRCAFIPAKMNPTMVIFLVLLQEVEEVEIMEAEEDMVEVADSLMVVVDLLNQVEMADSLMVVVEDLLNQVEVVLVEDIEVGLVEGLMILVEVADSLMVVVDLLNQVEMADSLMVVVEDLLNQVEVAVVEDIEVGLVEGLMTLVEMTDSLVILDPQPHSNTADNKVDTADNTVDNQYNNTSGNKVLNQVEVAVVEDIEVGLVAAFMTLVESKVVVDLLNQVEVAMDLLNLGDFESSSVFVYVYLY